MKKKNIITIIIILCVILLLVLIFILNRKSKEFPENPAGTVGNTAGNLYNGGKFCEDDEYVYFSNPYDNNALYRMRPDESEVTKLLSTPINNINCAGKYLYYYQLNSGEGQGLGYIAGSFYGIFMIEKGNPRKSVCLDKSKLDTMVLLGNSLYYDINSESDGVYLKRYNMKDKSSEQVLNYKVTPACASNGLLYFNNMPTDMHLKAYNPERRNVSDVYSEDVYNPIVDGSEIFYIDVHNNYALTKYNISTGTRTVLDSTRTDMFNLSGQNVYYQTSGDNPCLKSVSRNGGESQVIMTGAYNSINITSRYVYFTEFNTKMPVYKVPVDGPITVSSFDAAREAAIKNVK